MAGSDTDTHQYLRAWRKRRGKTLADVSRRIGSKVNTISGWETGNRRVNLDDLSRLAEVYELNVVTLLQPPEADELPPEPHQGQSDPPYQGVATLRDEDAEAQKVMGGRLRAVREALGLTQEDMAKNMGVVVTTLSAWESDRNQIGIVKLAKAATRWSFTTDWVARGDLSGLRKDLADKIEVLVTRGPPSPRRGRPNATT